MARRWVTSRGWRSVDDTADLRALVSRRLAVDWPTVRMHPGDLDWWSVQAWGDGRPPVSDRVRMWSIGGGDALAAFAWFTPPGDVDLVLDPTLTDDGRSTERDLIRGEAIDWALDRRRALAPDQAGPMRLWAAENSAEATLFEAVGRRADPEGDAFIQLTGRLDLLAPGPKTVPRGLRARPIADADVPARVSCSRAAFVTSTMTPDRYRQTFLAGSYQPELDHVVVDDAGSVLAFALAWYDPPTNVVELEPVGVHPDHHRRGLGTLVCLSALGAAAELGAKRVMIAADRRNEAALGLYRSLGLAGTSTIVPYALPVAGFVDPSGPVPRP